MLIDWFTVIAQAINFLILLLLLRRFLYGPIVRAMDEREARLAAQSESAEVRQREAQAEIEHYRRQQAELTARQDDLLRQAEAAAESQRKALVQQARQDADLMRQRWQESVAQESESFLTDLRRKAGTAALQLSRRALADLAGVSLEERMAAIFLDHLAQMPQEIWQRLSHSGPLEIASAHPLSAAAQEQFSHLVAQHTHTDAALHFQVEPDLVGGLELRNASYKIPWTLAGYLDEMEDGFVAALEGA